MESGSEEILQLKSRYIVVAFFRNRYLLIIYLRLTRTRSQRQLNDRHGNPREIYTLRSIKNPMEVVKLFVGAPCSKNGNTELFNVSGYFVIQRCLSESNLQIKYERRDSTRSASASKWSRGLL